MSYNKDSKHVLTDTKFVFQEFFVKNVRDFRSLDFKNNALLFISFVFLIFWLFFFEYSDFDLVVQNYFFDFSQKSWLIDKDEPIKKFIFYKFPKILFAIILIVILALIFLGCKNKSNFGKKNKNLLLLIFLGMSLIPLIAGNIKKFTNIYCPCQLAIYDGDKPYVRVFDSYPKGFIQEKKGQCFPAGHAVTGFSLFILFFALRQKNHKILGLLIGLVYGWILGLYQMAKGAHFFSDTFIAMLICLIIAALIAKIYFKFFEYD